MKKILAILVLNLIVSCSAFAQAITLNKENVDEYVNVDQIWFFDGYRNDHSVYIANKLGRDIFLDVRVEKGAFTLMCDDFIIGNAKEESSLGCLIKAGKSAIWINDAVGANVISSGTFKVSYTG